MIKYRGFFLFLVLLLAALFAFVSHVVPMAPAVSADTGRESQIREASIAWDVAFNAEDLEGIMALYADDSVSMPPGFTTSVGKEQIQADFEFIFGNFDLQHETMIVDILMSGNVAVEQATYEMTEGGIVVEAGKHIVVRKKFGRSWKVVKEIWNFVP
jgi:ketosteroid isomerase-like protein